MKGYKPYYLIVGLLLVATSLSFLDRQVLSISILKIKDNLSISDIEYGFINAGFLISYAIMFTLGGMIMDRYGSRFGLALSVGFWSFATILHSLATNAFHFGFFRFLLGAGEGGCFPGAVKAVTEWIPKKKQALANGIAIGGSALGAVIAPPLCALLLGMVSWRYVFIITGGFGFIWLLIWLIFTKTRSRHGEDHVRQIRMNRPRINLLELLTTKKVLLFVIVRFFLDPIFYFYMFWIPKFLNDQHNLSIDVIGKILWIPFLALGIANMFGGWCADIIYARTSNLGRSRKTVMGFAAVLTIPVLFCGYLPSSTIVIVLMALAFFAHGLWITNFITLISDSFESRVISTIVGLSGTAGAISSLVINPLIGLIITNYSYTPLWWYAGIAYPMAFLIFLFYKTHK